MPATKPHRRPRRPGLGKRDIKPLTKLPEYRRINTLAELEAVTDEPVVVELVINQKPIRLEGRRLTPDQERRVLGIEQQALPPELPAAEEGGEARYDFANPEYRATKESCRRKARALALFFAFPFFSEALKAAAQKALTAPVEERTEMFRNIAPDGNEARGIFTDAQIAEFIESRPLDDVTLQMIYGLVTREIVMVDPRRVGFTSGNNSRKD